MASLVSRAALVALPSASPAARRAAQPLPGCRSSCSSFSAHPPFLEQAQARQRRPGSLWRVVSEGSLRRVRCQLPAPPPASSRHPPCQQAAPPRAVWRHPAACRHPEQASISAARGGPGAPSSRARSEPPPPRCRPRGGAPERSARSSASSSPRWPASAAPAMPAPFRRPGRSAGGSGSRAG